MEAIAEDLWVQNHELPLLGMDLGRRVTIIRLKTGELVIHSTAPFQEEDVEAIQALGKPGWLVEATRMHDTFARAGRNAFPDIPYLAPRGFGRKVGVDCSSILPCPSAWNNELEGLRLEGVTGLDEHVFYHVPSRSLIVADLVFNFGPADGKWLLYFYRWAGGIRQYPGMSRLFRFMIRDRDAFQKSLHTVMEWDFDRLIMAHGQIIPTGGKNRLSEALKRADLL